MLWNEKKRLEELGERNRLRWAKLTPAAATTKPMPNEKRDRTESMENDNKITKYQREGQGDEFTTPVRPKGGRQPAVITPAQKKANNSAAARRERGNQRAERIEMKDEDADVPGKSFINLPCRVES